MGDSHTQVDSFADHLLWTSGSATLVYHMKTWGPKLFCWTPDVDDFSALNFNHGGSGMAVEQSTQLRITWLQEKHRQHKNYLYKYTNRWVNNEASTTAFHWLLRLSELKTLNIVLHFDIYRKLYMFNLLFGTTASMSTSTSNDCWLTRARRGKKQIAGIWPIDWNASHFPQLFRSK